jgi:hypothetical protein
MIQYLLIKPFISITILETTIQKERPVHGDLSSVNQVFNITTIMSGNFFNTNCDVVDYLMAHILSYLAAGLNGQCSHSITVCGIFGKIFSSWNPQRKQSHRFKS